MRYKASLKVNRPHIRNQSAKPPKIRTLMSHTIGTMSIYNGNNHQSKIKNI